jgi:hypothetical protein
MCDIAKSTKHMDQLVVFVNTLANQYESHSESLNKAQQQAEEVLGTLESAASSAISLRESMTRSIRLGGWWPYIYCPVASLLLGSYGLPPSALRNLTLIGLGLFTKPLFIQFHSHTRN